MKPSTNEAIRQWQDFWTSRFWHSAPMMQAAAKRLRAMEQAHHKEAMDDPKNPASYCPDDAEQAARRVYNFYHARAREAFEHLAALDLATLDELEKMRELL